MNASAQRTLSSNPGLRVKCWREIHANFHDKTALVFEKKRFTYAELNRRVNCLANALAGARNQKRR